MSVSVNQRILSLFLSLSLSLSLSPSLSLSTYPSLRLSFQSCSRVNNMRAQAKRYSHLRTRLPAKVYSITSHTRNERPVITISALHARPSLHDYASMLSTLEVIWIIWARWKGSISYSADDEFRVFRDKFRGYGRLTSGSKEYRRGYDASVYFARETHTRFDW